MRKFLIKVSGDQYEVEVEEIKKGRAVPATAKNGTPSVTNAPATISGSEAHKGRCKIDSPMPGSILKIKVKVGDEVKKGQAVFVLEAMKMENEISAPVSGKIVEVLAGVGDTVAVGQTIIIID